MEMMKEQRSKYSRKIYVMVIFGVSISPLDHWGRQLLPVADFQIDLLNSYTKVEILYPKFQMASVEILQRIYTHRDVACTFKVD